DAARADRPLVLAASGARLALGWVEGTQAAPVAQVRGDRTATLPGAQALDLAWLGDTLLALWQDVADPAHAALALTRFDAAGLARLDRGAGRFRLRMSVDVDLPAG